MASRVTRSMTRRTTTRNILPPEIELYILEWLMTPHNTSKDRLSRPSNFACVCKGWQRIIEKSTFRHMSLRPDDISTFARLVGPFSGRRGHVKHVLLEIPVGETDDEPPFNLNNGLFTRAVSRLWKVLSPWKHHSLTVELGIFSPFETSIRPFDSSYFDRVQDGTPQTLLVDPHIDHASRFENPPTHLVLLDMWIWEKWRYLGSRALEFEFGEHHSLPSARVITRLVLRRRYFRNINGKALSEMFKAAPCLEVIHLERWCYGRMKSDIEWDKDSYLIGLNLPSSLKQFSFYDEFSTMYHHQGRMQIPRSNRRLLRSLAENTWSNQLEHLSISFAFDAQDFVSPRFNHNWASLKALALTSNLVLTRSNLVVNELLMDVAEAAKHMPRLEMVEIWNCKIRDSEAGIFRYEKLDRAGKIVWQGTWELDMSSQVKQAWREVLVGPEGGNDDLGVELISLQPKELIDLGSMYSCLKLKKYVIA